MNKKLLMFLVFCLASFLVVSPVLSETKVSTDPMRLGVGARALGMGKMGLSLGDDVGSLFLNPAGISQLNDWQIMTMTGQFINEISYLQFGGTFRTDYGTFGLGYVGAGIGAEFPKPFLITVEGGDIRIVPTTEVNSYSFNDAVFLLSYGTKLGDYADWGWIKPFSVGASLKVFSIGLSGTDIYGGTGSGYNMDLGLLYKPNSWLSAGITGQNVVSADMGGKITWATGQEEVIPSSMKIGTSAKLVGKGGLYEYGMHELYAGLDMDTGVAPELPSLLHLGVEWWPIEYIALRGGVDQDYVGSGGGGVETTNNFTAGVGFLYSGFRFDYAFHQYNDIPENDTHYFSLSYNIFKDQPTAAPTSTDYIRISQPSDKSTVSTDNINLVGQVTDLPTVKRVTVNGAIVSISPNGTFSSPVALKLGKNLIKVIAMDANGSSVKQIDIRVIRLIAFKDVPEGYWAKDVIGEIASLGIVTGYPDGTFRPDGPITRAELTTLLIKALGVTFSERTEVPLSERKIGTPFSDLAMSHWAAKYIMDAVDKKYVLGYPDNTFRPQNKLNKAEGVVVLARFGELKEPDTILEGPYSDVPGRHWAAKLIMAAKEAGFLTYIGNKPFEPANELTRAEAVEILSHTKFAKGKISDLTDFNTGF